MHWVLFILSITTNSGTPSLTVEAIRFETAAACRAAQRDMTRVKGATAFCELRGTL